MSNRIGKVALNRKVTNLMISFIMLMSIVPLVIIGIYSRPCVDDYSYAKLTHELIASGNWNVFSLLEKAAEVDAYFYNNWQGLYSSAFILSLQPGIFGERYYFIGVWVLMLLMFICTYYFVKTVFSLLQIKHYHLAMTSFIFVVILQGLPSAIEGLYWFNGAWNYTPFFFLSLVNLSVIIRYIFFPKNAKRYIFVSALLSFVISGGNHVTGFLNILLLLCLTIPAFMRKKRYVLISLVSAIIGFVIMYTAPGTVKRQDVLNKRGIIETLIHSVLECYNRLQEWVNFNWVIYLFILTMIVLIVHSKKKIEKEIFRISPIIFVVVFLMILCGLLCVPYMAMGSFGAGRLQNVIWFFFMFSTGAIWCYTVFYVALKMDSIKINMQSTQLLGVTIVMFLLSCFYPECNAVKAMSELNNGMAREFAEVCDERYSLIEDALQSDNTDMVLVNKLPDESMLYLNDISKDSDDWRNQSWDSYYGIKTIPRNVEYRFDSDFAHYVLEELRETPTILIVVNTDVLQSRGFRRILHGIDYTCADGMDMMFPIMVNGDDIDIVEEGLISGAVFSLDGAKYSYFENDNKQYGLYLDNEEIMTGNVTDFKPFDVVTITNPDDKDNRDIEYWRIMY